MVQRVKTDKIRMRTNSPKCATGDENEAYSIRDTMLRQMISGNFFTRNRQFVSNHRIIAIITS